MLARLNMLKMGLLLAGLLAQDALALGLGNITLSSSLNEPLEATIELIDIGNLDASQILVALGTAEDFARVDLERSPFLTGIEFTVRTSGDTGLIRLTTTANVVEPYLSLLVDARWPTGRVLREYTLLIDLPDFSQPAQVQPARTTATITSAAEAARPVPTTPAIPPAPVLVATPEPTPATNTRTNTAAINSDGTFTVSPGDTMLEIAAATRPDASVSVQQMMVAIQRANEDAFLGNNINRVRSGRVLRIPPLQDIRSIDQATAIAQISRQNLAPGGQPLAVNNTGAAPATGARQDELSVLNGDQAALPSGGVSDLQATIAALESELMLSEENLDRARLENLELNARISSLDDEIGLLRNIIAIEDERIAQLQAELASQSQATAVALAQAQTSADALAALDDQPQAGMLGQLNRILQNGMILLGLLVALVLVVLGFLVMRRRTAEAEAEEHVFNPAMHAAAPERLARYAGQAPQEKTSMLAGVLARLRRNENDADLADKQALDSDLVRAPLSPPAQAFARAPSLAAAAHPDFVMNDEAERLPDATGISDASVSRDEPLSDSDDEAFSAIDDSFMAGTELVQPREIDLADEIELEKAEHMEATADTMLPASVDFVPAPMAALDAVEIAPEAAVPEAFEFTLRETPAVDVSSPDEIELVESLDFTLNEPAPLDLRAGSMGQAVYPDDEMDADLEMALNDISFDDTMLPDDDDEDEGPYKSRSGMDECDTKLDLATAYEAMGDVDDALEILNEVIADGNSAQVEMANKLKQSWQSV